MERGAEAGSTDHPCSPQMPRRQFLPRHGHPSRARLSSEGIRPIRPGPARRDVGKRILALGCRLAYSHAGGRAKAGCPAEL